MNITIIGEIMNYKGTYKAQIVEVLEGNGKSENPWTIVRYVILNGTTIGTVKELSEPLELHE